MINRDLEVRLTKQIESSSKIILLYGARQVGKTTLIKQILSQISKKILFVNGDLGQGVEEFSQRDLNLMRQRVAGYDILYIDEAQRIPDVGINLKILHDHLPQLKIVVSGSSSIDLAARTKEALTGRATSHLLYPITITEWQQHNGWNDFEVKSQLNELLRFGSYPELLSIKGNQDKISYLEELSTAYLYKDILAIANISYPEKIISLLRLLAFQIGHEVSIQDLSKKLGIHRDAIKNYIDLLEKSFIIFRLGGFSRNLRKEVTKMDKIYFYDLGIRNALIRNFNNLAERIDHSQLWENFIISERLKTNSYQRKGANIYFWRVYTGAELDFVEEKEGRLFGYEIKWQSKKKSPPASFLETYKEASFQLINRNNFLDFLKPN